MKVLTKILILGYLSLLAVSCNLFPLIGSGTIISESRDVASFSMVSVEGQADVEAVMGSTQSITITTDDNIIGEIETFVENGKLRVRNKPFTFFAPTNGIKVSIVMVSQPTNIDISGTGKFDWLDANRIDTPDLVLTISGTGSMNLTHTGTSLSIDVSGAGNAVISSINTSSTSTISGAGSITYSGAGSTASIAISGTGEYNAYDFTTTDTNVTISGAGSAYIYASNSLVCSISGAGSVYYRGNPTISISGSGTGTVNPG